MRFAINALRFARIVIILYPECAANVAATLKSVQRLRINPARILTTENGNEYMILKVEIKKIKNTCIMLDSVLFKPVETKDNIDYYELPCELLQSYDLKVIHYAGDSFNGIGAVLDRNGKGAFKSVISETASCNIDLYYCEITASFIASKQNAFLHFEVLQITGKDLLSCFSYCNLRLIQHKNIDLSDCIYHCYPSKRIKRFVFLIEIISSLFIFAIFMIMCLLATSNRVEMEMLYDPSGNFGIYSYLVFLPVAIADIVWIIIRIAKISKNTLKIDRK